MWFARRAIGPVFCGIGFAGHAIGAQWSAAPHVRATMELNDNRRLTTLPHETVFGRLLVASTVLSAQTETAQLRVTPEVRIQRFSGEQGLDTNDQRLDVDALRATELGRFGATASYIRDTTLDSELEGTGVIVFGVRREEKRLGASGSYAWSERISAQANVDYADIHYDDSTDGGFADFDNTSASASLTRHSEIDQISATIFMSEFASAETFNSTRTFGFQGTYDHAFSETLAGSFTGGMRLSDLAFRRAGVEQESRSTGTVVDLRLTKEWERSALTVTASRSAVPTGGGELLERSDLGFSAHRSFRHNLTGSIRGRFFRDESLDQDDSTSTRDLYELGLQLSWRITPEWSVSGAYRYLRQEREDGSDVPESNAFTVTLSYDPTRFAVSR